ncbi:hypothetical protein FQZ97_1025380 [compost metagenome]
MLCGLHQRRVAEVEAVALHIVGTETLRKKCLDLAEATALHGIEERDLRLCGRRVASGLGLRRMCGHVERETCSEGHAPVKKGASCEHSDQAPAAC